MPKIKPVLSAESQLDRLIYDRTDDNVAKVFAKVHAEHYRFVTEREKWYAWDGEKWSDTTSKRRVQRAVIDMAAGSPVNTLGDADTEPRKSLTKRQDEVRSTKGSSAIVSMSETILEFYSSLTSFDMHAWDLNTPTGIVNMATGEITENTPAAHHTKITEFGMPNSPSEYKTPMWNTFLNRTFGGDKELINYMQRLVGYSATGDVTVHVVPFLYGEGSNGKSVFVNIVRSVLGNDYCATLKKSILMSGQNQGHLESIARLKGKRLAVAAEVNAEDQFDEARFKEMSGGDELTGNFMRENSFDFKPTHTMWMMGNHKPSVANGGVSFWRRLRLIPFDYIVPDAEKDEHLTEKIVAAEAAGILAWIVQGARLFHEEGLGPTPSRVSTLTDQYAENENVYGQFLEERCAVDVGQEIPASAVYDMFRSWYDGMGLPGKPESMNKFAEEFDRLLGIKRKQSATKGWDCTGTVIKRRTARGVVYTNLTGSF